METHRFRYEMTSFDQILEFINKYYAFLEKNDPKKILRALNDALTLDGIAYANVDINIDLGTYYGEDGKLITKTCTHKDVGA